MRQVISFSLKLMTPDIILSLLQSFRHEAGKPGFPEPLMANERFGKMAARDLEADAVKGVLDFLCLGAVDGKGSLRDFAEQLCSLWQSGPHEICFRTSGSTGEPKPCIHSEHELWQEAQFLKTLLGDRKGLVSCAPPHHCYGFMFGLFLPYFLGIPVKRLPPFGHIFFSSLKNGYAGIGLPFMYEAIQSANMAANEGDIILISATSPFAPDAFRNLAGKGFRIIEIFGSSETGVLGWREDPASPFRLAPYFSANGAGTIRRLESGREISLMDSLEWEGAGYFYPRGRLDTVIQVGGINVSAGKVAGLLRQIPGVRDCAIRSVRPGGRLKAFIALKEGSCKDTVRKAVLAASSAFSVAERPVRFDFGKDLPRNAMGKLADWD